MSRANLTDVLLIIDESGSMQAISSEVTTGVQNFLRPLREDKDHEYRVSVFAFTTPFQKEFRQLRASVNDLSYTHAYSNLTPLHDAICYAVDQLGATLANLPEEQRPGKVTCLIITDGLENASQENQLEDVRKRITHQTEVYGWDFSYLGANVDSFAEGAKYGVPSTGVMNYQHSVGGTQGMFASAGASTVRYSSSGTRTYTDEERAASAGEGTRKPRKRTP